MIGSRTSGWCSRRTWPVVWMWARRSASRWRASRWWTCGAGSPTRPAPGRGARTPSVGVYSTTKTMTALTALLVADRGELEFEAPVARYWPEFAAGGKDRVTVAQLMSHSAGLCGWRAPITRDDLYDWEKVTALLAAQEPFWKPGTASGYHAMTQGYLVGEVVLRITGRSLGTVFREEIAAPLGADFHIGLPSSQDERVAELIAPAGPAPMDGAGDSELRVNVAGDP